MNGLWGKKHGYFSRNEEYFQRLNFSSNKRALNDSRQLGVGVTVVKFFVCIHCAPLLTSSRTFFLSEKENCSL